MNNDKMTLAEAKRVTKRAKTAEGKARKEKTRKSALKLVGKCFVYQNGGGGKAWPVYVKVLAVSSVYDYIATLWSEEIQAAPEDLYGISVHRHGRWDAYYGKMDERFVPISEEEYNQKTNVILAMLGVRRT